MEPGGRSESDVSLRADERPNSATLPSTLTDDGGGHGGPTQGMNSFKIGTSAEDAQNKVDSQAPPPPPDLELILDEVSKPAADWTAFRVGGATTPAPRSGMEGRRRTLRKDIPFPEVTELASLVAEVADDECAAAVLDHMVKTHGLAFGWTSAVLFEAASCGSHGRSGKTSSLFLAATASWTWCCKGGRDSVEMSVVLNNPTGFRLFLVAATVRAAPCRCARAISPARLGAYHRRRGVDVAIGVGVVYRAWSSASLPLRRLPGLPAAMPGAQKCLLVSFS